jgi:hypothetical protein
MGDPTSPEPRTPGTPPSPPQTPADQNPAAPAPSFTVSAGADQSVEDNALVSLTGAVTPASAGAVYAWTQVAGSVVTLVGADTPTLAFTAPNHSDTLTFRLRVTSPQGQAEDEVVISVKASPFLFVANRGGSVARFLATPRLEGEVAPLGLLSGANARLSGPSSIVLDKIGGLVVTNAYSHRIAGYLNATTITGDIAPERYVGGAASLISVPESSAYDAVTDVIYVANFDSFPGTVNVYAAISTPSFFGELPPTRQIRSMDIMNPRDLELAASGELYVLNAGSHSVSSFASAATLNGVVEATRSFWSNDMLDLLIDSELAGDTLLVADATNRRMLIFDKVSQLDGEVSPARILNVPGFGQLGGIVVDANGTGYISDGTNNAIYIYPNIAAQSGAVDPARTLSGGMTSLADPGKMAVLER